CMVARKQNPFAMLIKVIVYAFAGFFCVLGIIGFTYMFIPGLALIAAGYFLLPNLDLEFEYLYLDKEITIDKVMAKQKRKRVMVLDLNKMEIMAPVTSHELDSYKARKVPMKDYGSKMPDSKLYAIVYHDQNKEELVCIEPNTEMLRAIKTVFPRKVIEY
ncbi:MAG TPA: DUF6106 family protein, partial [Lachnospiraceae bacterium]|nr:DUF6106 family protein [Lachnospiraceae bacterium]